MKQNLVLIPGVGATEAFWQYQVSQLGTDANIQILLANQHDNKQALLNTLESQLPNEFILCGHSFGGWLAQSIAATYPERVKKLILINTWASKNESFITAIKKLIQLIKAGAFYQFIEDNAATLIHPGNPNQASIIIELKKMLLNTPLIAYLNQYQAIVKECETLTELNSITAKTLVIHSEDDTFFSMDESLLMTKHIKDATFTLINDCGHNSLIEQPQAITALIRLWLNL